MNKKILNIINIGTSICLVICSYLLIINLCNQRVFSSYNIQRELSDTSFLSIINSKHLNKNSNVIKVKQRLNIVYSITDKIGINDNDINKILDSDISRSIFTKVTINILEYIKTGEDRSLFSLNDLNMIIDDKIDANLESNKINLNFIKKKILSKALKEVGKKILDDIPNTSDSIKNTKKLNLFKIIYSDKAKDNLYILIIIFLLLLIMLNKKEVLVNYLKNCFLAIAFFLLSTFLYLKILILDYGNEWEFLKKLINMLNINIFICSMVLILISSVIYLYRKKKRKG